MFRLLIAIVVLNAMAVASNAAGPLAGKKPNVIFILTDDQGPGDLSARGNPILKTPHIDRLYTEGVRFQDFMVSPTCSPTRSAMLTGRHEFKNGVTHTIYERERLAPGAITAAQMLKSAGYTTGIFGKWHLGDEPDRRPDRRGFDEVFIHGCGGIGQHYPGSCGDAPGNNYFDPAIYHNGKFEKTKGYCTDIFFDRATQWIDKVKSGDEPFFCYIPTNAPHAPLEVRPEDEARYTDKVKSPNVAKYYGMIANIDDNVGRLMSRLKEWNLDKNTLVIFISDNGGTFGTPIYNNGYRGKKGTPWLGGVEAISIWWMPGTLQPGTCDALTDHIDFFPTLADLAGVKVDGKLAQQVEGRSLVPLLNNVQADWPTRTLFTHVGRWPVGADVNKHKYDACAVRTPRWHLVSPSQGGPDWQLYDVIADRGEKNNVAAAHPEVATQLNAEYDVWWASLPPYLVNEKAKYEGERPYDKLYREQYGQPMPAKK